MLKKSTCFVAKMHDINSKYFIKVKHHYFPFSQLLTNCERHDLSIRAQKFHKTNYTIHNAEK